MTFGRFDTPFVRILPKLVLFYMVGAAWSFWTDWWLHTLCGITMGLMYGQELLPAATHRHVMRLYRRRQDPVDTSVDERYRR